MTADEIAQHALLLAALLDQQAVLINAQQSLVANLVERLSTVQNVLADLDGAVRAIRWKIDNDQARTARELLVELASVPRPPDMPPITIALEPYAMPTWVGSPVGSSRSPG